MSKLGIYVHIPFCKSKCKYCDFYSIPSLDLENSYVNRLLDEIEYNSKFLSDRVVDTIYFGGGTPTALSNGLLARIFDKINNSFNVESKAEITVEANPDTVTEEKINELKLFANRISVGVQSLSDDVLKFAGRIHTSKDALNAIDKLVHKFSVNADLILGLPLSNVESSQKSAQTLINKGIDHLSCYGLKVENGTPFSKIDKSVFPDDDSIADEYDAVKSICKENNLLMYEVSNFAKQGKECKHNIRYWDRSDYLGVGVSAHSFLDSQRFYNPSDIKAYLKSKNNEIRVLDGVIDSSEGIKECIMLSLRTKRGIDCEKFKKEFGIEFFDKYKETIKKLEPYLLIKDGFISIKEQHFYAMNSIIVEFLS